MERKAWMGLALPVWVLAAFGLSQVIAGVVIGILVATGVPLNRINEPVFNTVLAAVIYILTLALVVGIPWLIKKYRTTREDVGLSGWPSWIDLLLAPAGFVVYIVTSALLTALAVQLLPSVDFNQVQDTGFNQLGERFEYILAFVTLVILAPLAEEILFRGYLFGKLRKHVPLWVAIGVTSLAFALVHGAVNVGIDVFALSIVLCLLRVVSGSLWPSILLHMLKNGLAYYLLFINPTFI